MTENKCNLAPHYVPFHGISGEEILSWGSKWVKVVDPDPGLLRWLKDRGIERIVARLFFVDETVRRLNPQSAAKWTLDTFITHAASRYVDVWEALNEPGDLQDAEDVKWLVTYWKELLRRATEEGVRICWGNFGNGQPPGVGNAGRPFWDPFEEVAFVNKDLHFLGLHEYWDESGPQACSPWWAGRFTMCPFQVPVLITECGFNWDARCQGRAEEGWRAHISAEQYIAQLGEYLSLLRSDERIQAAFVYTLDYAAQKWASFDVRDLGARIAQLNATVKHRDAWVEPQLPASPPPSQTTGEDMRALVREAAGYLGKAYDILRRLENVI